MEYNLWKSVLLDWVNSTGFLVQNYENLGDTNIDTFFEAFKRQIKSTQIKSKDVISFIREYYKDFYLKLDDKGVAPVGEYVYYYSLFLHFACVLHADTGIQQICNNMVRKNQEVIEKFLDYLFKIGKCERALVQSAIEEAECCDLTMAQQSPITRNIQSLLSNTSPQTPKSRMLNTWNLENRNLKAQLETERFERGYLEMQLNQCEKKLFKLDEDYKEAMVQNNILKKQIQSLDEHDQLAQIAQSDVAVKHLRREIDDKESELFKLSVACNDAKNDIETLKEKLQYAESQIKSLNVKLVESFGEAETFKNQLEEREKMISYMNNNIKELSDLLKELQSNSKKQDFDSSSSYDMLNSTTNDLNSSSFMVGEENLASAVVDIRLLDQQKQNLVLNESVNRLQNELFTLQEEANKLYKTMAMSDDDGVESPSPNAVFSTFNEKYTKMAQANQNLTKLIDSHTIEIASLYEQISDLKNTIIKSKEELLDQQNRLESLTEEKKMHEEKITSLTETISQHEKKLVDYKLKSSQIEELISEKAELVENLNVTTSKLKETAKSLEAEQNQNLTLNETVTRLQNDLSVLHEEAIKLYKTMAMPNNDDVDPLSPNAIFFALNEKNVEMIETNKNLSKEIENHIAELTSLKDQVIGLNATINSLNEKLQSEETKYEDLLNQNHDTVDKLTEAIKVNENILANCELKSSIILQLTSEKAALDEHLKSTANKLEDTVKLLEVAQNDLTTVNTEKIALATKVAQLNCTVDEMTLQMSQEKEQFDEKLHEASEEMSLVVNVRDSLQEQLKQCQNDVIEQRKVYDALVVEKDNLNEQLTKMAETNQSLSHDVESHSTEITSLKKNISDLECTITTSKDQLSDREEQLKTLSEEKRLLEEKVNSLTETISKNETILADYDLKSIKINELISEKAVLNENLQSITKKLEETAKSLEVAENRLTTLNNEKDSLLSKITKLNSTINELEQQMLQKNEQSNEKQKELSEKLSLVLNDKESLQEQVRKLEDDASNQRIAYDALKDEKMTLVTEVEEHTKNIGVLQESLAKLQDENKILIESSEKDSEQLNEKLRQTSEELSIVQKEKDSLQEQFMKIDGDFTEHRKAFDALAEEKATLVAKVEECTKNIKVLQESLTKQQNENKLLAESVASKEHEFEKLNENLKQTSEELSSVSNEKDSLQEQFTKIQEDITQQHKQFDALTEEKLTLVTKVEDCTKRIESLQESLIKLQEENKVLIEASSNKETDNKQLNEKLKQTSEELSIVQKEKDSLQEQLTKIEGDVTDQRKEFDELMEEKVALVTKVEECNKNIEMLQESLAKLQDENKTLIETSTEKAEDNKQLNEKLKQTNEELSLVQKERDSLQVQLSKIEGDRTEQHKQFDILRAENVALVIKVDECTKKIEVLQESLTKHQDENKVLSESVANKEKENEQLNKKLAKTNDMLSSLQKHNDSLHEQLKQIEDDASELRKEYDLKSSKIDEFTTEMASLDANLKSTNIKLEETLKSLEMAQNDLATVNTEKNSLVSKVIQLNRSIDELTQQMLQEKEEFGEMQKAKSEELLSMQKEKDSLQDRLVKFEMDATEQRKLYDTLAAEKVSLVSKVAECTENIEMLKESLTKVEVENKALIESSSRKEQEKEQLSEKLKMVNDELSLIQKDREQLTKIEGEAMEQLKKFDTLMEEKISLVAKVEEYTKNIEGLQETVTKLQNENKSLIDHTSTNKEQLLTVNEQLVRMEKTNNEQTELWKKEKESLIQDVKICRAKLMKEREAAEQKEKEFKIMRNAYEEKLDKMKDKMKTLYKEEMAKVQDKHEKQLNELVMDNRRQTDKLMIYEDKIKEYSSQIHSLNEEKLMLLKEHEIMKSKLRTYEIDSTLNRANGTSGSSMLFDKLRGGNFRMEDEEGELFDNTYLDELQRGSGRESITLDEIQRRNSMVPPHLRSSYMPQYPGDETKPKENQKSLDDSLFSNASESRRGTAYKRPGPPTPSKNGGRLSFGGGELPRGDILREQNGHNERPSLGGTSKATKKSTPGKLSRIFSASKLKDEVRNKLLI